MGIVYSARHILHDVTTVAERMGGTSSETSEMIDRKHRAQERALPVGQKER